MSFQLKPASIWIFQKYLELEKDLQTHVQTYELAHVVQAIYTFVWDYYADWYVEYLKTDPSQLEFGHMLFKKLSILISPYLPFETEVLWMEFFKEKTLLSDTIYTREELVAIERETDFSLALEFQNVIEIISQLRSIRGLFGIDPYHRLVIFSTNKIFQEFDEFISLTGKAITVTEDQTKFYKISAGNIDFHINILTYIKDIALERERTEKHIQSLNNQISALEKQLNNSEFIQHGDPAVVEEKKSQLSTRIQELDQMKEKIKFLNAENY